MNCDVFPECFRGCTCDEEREDPRTVRCEGCAEVVEPTAAHFVAKDGLTFCETNGCAAKARLLDAEDRAEAALVLAKLALQNAVYYTATAPAGDLELRGVAACSEARRRYVEARQELSAARGGA